MQRVTSCLLPRPTGKLHISNCITAFSHFKLFISFCLCLFVLRPAQIHTLLFSCLPFCLPPHTLLTLHLLLVSVCIYLPLLPPPSGLPCLLFVFLSRSPPAENGDVSCRRGYWEVAVGITAATSLLLRNLQRRTNKEKGMKTCETAPKPLSESLDLFSS